MGSVQFGYFAAVGDVLAVGAEPGDGFIRPVSLSWLGLNWVLTVEVSCGHAQHASYPGEPDLSRALATRAADFAKWPQLVGQAIASYSPLFCWPLWAQSAAVGPDHRAR